ncbi:MULTISPECIES: hypothetical protein [Nocardia]|uniref:hypothetical protein n=1 Tax=Nocardia TaxID=1817 RepID=UPI000D697F1D|nr:MULTISPECIES: hypothetical protein [Nocardia]
MSSVTKRTVTHLDVVFDAEVVDPATGAVVYSRPLPARFSEHDNNGTFDTLRFPIANPPEWAVLNLRLDGRLWRSCEVEMPPHGGTSVLTVAVRARMSGLLPGEWEQLLAMTEEAA